MLGRYKELSHKRTPEQLRHHYEVEKGIADRLRCASREQRTRIMKTMYDELFAHVPDHPRLTERNNHRFQQVSIASQEKFLRHYLNPGHTFLEFGPGNCDLAFALCSRVAHVYAVDISERADLAFRKPKNFNFIVYDGFNLELPNNSIDVVFSNQMIEHIHPDDTADHFRLVYRLLKPHGVYIFCTPEKLCGPSDISRYFSNVSQGFHLREWSFRELGDLVRDVGFSRWQGCWYARGICFLMPRQLILALERAISLWPVKVRQCFGRYFLPSVTMIVQK